MLDEFGVHYIEGGWPGSNPKDIEFFAAAAQADLAARQARRVRQHPPQGQQARRDDPNLQALLDAETPVVTIFGKSWLLHVTEVLGATPDENLDMIADSVGYLKDHGREVDLRRRALLRRLQGETATTRWPRCGRPTRPEPDCWSCATPTAAP